MNEMTGTWLILSVLLPILAAGVSGLLIRKSEPEPILIICLNALMPGAGLAAAGRPLLETVGGVLLAQAGLITIGRPQDLVFWAPVAVVGGLWASYHTRLNPLAHAARTTSTAQSSESTSERRMVAGREASSPLRATPPYHESGSQAGSRRGRDRPRPKPSARQPGDQNEPEICDSYTVSVTCTECGAAVEVAVLSHMASCQYCGSDHMVVGQDQTLQLSIPEKISTRQDLIEAVLDHLRYRYYLKLYQRQVAPLEGGALSYTVDGNASNRPEMDAAVAAAEALVSAKADSYRKQIANKLEIRHEQRFLAPYRHGMGTLYQAAFGREEKSHEKRLRFAIGTIEASTLANDLLELPRMGKLSYLRALIPAAQQPTGTKALPLAKGPEELESAYGELDRKRLVRELQVIRLGSVFAEEVRAVIWRPWWITEIQGPGIRETLLIDGASASVAGPAPFINPEVFEDLPAEATEQGHTLRFLPMECPDCGHELTLHADAVLHFCANCHRLCEISGGRKRIRAYDHVPGAIGKGVDLVPFWRFRLRLRTSNGELLTDLLRLKDGIDGTFDQIGDNAPVRDDSIYIPAIRCINTKLMARAFNRLFLYSMTASLRPEEGPISLDLKPEPLDACIDESEARKLAPLCLANAFGHRDLARVNVHQVASWLFDAKLESQGRLTYVPTPLQVTNPFRRYVGRFRGQALDQAKLG